jgi:hypothetical protein
VQFVAVLLLERGDGLGDVSLEKRLAAVSAAETLGASRTTSIAPGGP